MVHSVRATAVLVKQPKPGFYNGSVPGLRKRIGIGERIDGGRFARGHGDLVRRVVRRAPLAISWSILNPAGVNGLLQNVIRMRNQLVHRAHAMVNKLVGLVDVQRVATRATDQGDRPNRNKLTDQDPGSLYRKQGIQFSAILECFKIEPMGCDNSVHIM